MPKIINHLDTRNIKSWAFRKEMWECAVEAKKDYNVKYLNLIILCPPSANSDRIDSGEFTTQENDTLEEKQFKSWNKKLWEVLRICTWASLWQR